MAEVARGAPRVVVRNLQRRAELDPRERIVDGYPLVAVLTEPSSTIPGYLARLRAIGESHGVAGLDERVLRWVGARFLDERWARLDQAGRTDLEKIRLSKVFVDATREGAGKDALGFVATLLKSSFHTLANPLRSDRGAPGGVWSGDRENRSYEKLWTRDDGLALRLGHLRRDDDMDSVLRRRGRFGVRLIGGPGQGKSTTTQFLCQVHRAAWLVDGGVYASPVEVSEAHRFRDDCRGSGLFAPEVPALPLRFDLARVADSLPSNRGSVFDYLRREMNLAHLSNAGLVEALRSVPCLLVLDGLDEVPISGARGALWEAFDGFFEALCPVDGALVLSTRPQGYGGELGVLDEWRVAPWSADTATRYTRHLLEERYADRHDEQERILERVRESLRDEGTARLMTTPLQVTMMAALVARIGRAPRERWRLFYEYQRLVVAREIEKGGGAAEVLRRHQRLVLEIHQDVALALHAATERGGASSLNLSQLRAVVVARVAAQRVLEGARDALVEKILAASLARLVFLVQPSQGRFGFEVHSLEEFFAAGALVNGAEEVIRDRLEAVARGSHWRNVLIFAVGRVMDELSAQSQEDVTVNLCARIELEGYVLDTLGRPGSLLALDLLQDGAVLAVPGLARELVERALWLVDLPEWDSWRRLAAVCADELVHETTGSRDLIWAALASHLQEAELAGRPTRPLWNALVELAERGVPQARATFLLWWQRAMNEGPLEALWSWGTAAVQQGGWIESLLFDLLSNGTPVQFKRTSGILQLPEGRFWSRLSELLVRFEGSVGGEHRMSISLPSIFTTCSPPMARDELERLSVRHGGGVVQSREHFLVAPSSMALAELLRHEAEAWRQETTGWESQPWIVNHCLLLAETPDELDEIAERVRAGEFGDTEDWRAAERRWIDQGITPQDVIHWRRYGLDAAIGTIGMSLAWSSGYRPQTEVLQETRRDGIATLQELLHAAIECSTVKVRQALMKLAAGVASWLIDARIQGAVEFPSDRADLLRLVDPSRVALHLLSFIARASDDDPGWCAWLDRLAEEGCFERDQYAGPDFTVHFGRWLSRWWDDPLRRPRVELLVAELADRGVSSQDHPAVQQARAMRPSEFTSPEAAQSAFNARHRDSSVSADALLSHWDELHQRGFDAHFGRSLYELSQDGARRFVALWRSLAPDEHTARENLLQAVRAYQYRRAAALERGDRWSRLRLPMPSPSELAFIPAPAPPVVEVPTPLPARFEIANFRGLRDLVIDLPPGRGEQGVTLLVLGRNGLGKTTLLRALALALVDPAVASGVLAQTTTPFRRDGCDEARCVVRTSAGEYAVTIQNGGEVERVVDPRPPDGPRPFVVAYGCRRGSALGSSVQRVDPSPANDIDNLFDQPLGLTNTEAWLAQLKAASNDRGDDAWQVYEHVREALKALLPGVSLLEIRADRRVWVTFEDPALGDVRWTALSDGYLTTAGWAVDLMARWIERQTNRLKLPVRADFREVMTGYALIDEIDLHLHPAWQTRVIADARRIFPRVNFIVTTHNPLTLVGARPGEVRVLVRDADTGDVRAVDPTAGDPSSDPRLLTGTELYRTYFGIDDVHPDEAGRLLREYHYLAANPYRSDAEDAQLAKMREDLAREGITPNIPPVAREALPEDES